MNSQPHNISFYRLLAKKLKRENNITHVQALNEIAKLHGFLNWTDCQRQTTSIDISNTFVAPEPISFTDWLTMQKNRDTPLGDLSKDMLTDPKWPLLDN